MWSTFFKAYIRAKLLLFFFFFFFGVIRNERGQWEMKLKRVEEREICLLGEKEGSNIRHRNFPREPQPKVKIGSQLCFKTVFSRIWLLLNGIVSSSRIPSKGSKGILGVLTCTLERSWLYSWRHPTYSSFPADVCGRHELVTSHANRGLCEADLHREIKEAVSCFPHSHCSPCAVWPRLRSGGWTAAPLWPSLKNISSISFFDSCTACVPADFPLWGWGLLGGSLALDIGLEMLPSLLPRLSKFCLKPKWA